MYVTDVEDIDDEQEDEKWEKEATGPNLKGTNKPLMTQSIHFENNLRNSSARFVKDTTRSIHTEDGSSLNVVDGQLSAADSAENNEAKNIYEKNLRATLAYYTGKSSLKSEGISKDVRETREGEGYDNLESGESRLNSGKPVVSFQSTSGEYSVSRSSNGELLILVNGELYRHVKEEDIEDTLTQKTLPLKKLQAPDPREKSTPQCKEKATTNSLSTQVPRSIERDQGHHLIFSTVSIERRKQGTHEPRDQPETRPKTHAIRFEDWSQDVEQAEFSKTRKSQGSVDYLPKPPGGHLQPKYASSNRFHLSDDSQEPRHQIDKERSSKRKEREKAASREKHYPLDTKCRDPKLSRHRTASSICDCKEADLHENEGEGVHEGSNISQQSDKRKCKCRCDDCLKERHLRVAGFQSQAIAYVESSRQKRCRPNCCCKSKAERKIFSNVVSRRKGCEYEFGKRNKHISSGHCDELGLFGSIPRSYALAGKSCSHSLSRDSSCCSYNLQSVCCDGFSHSQLLHDCPDTSTSPNIQACEDMSLQGLKAAGVTSRRRGRPIPTACSQQYRSDFESPPIEPGITDKSTTIRSLLIDKENHPNHRVVGEIAGQLESRIVQYVFAGLDRKSSYGTIVRNIPEVIEISCFDREHKKVNVPLQFRLVKRFAYVKTSLRPFGYNFDFHPQFSIDMVNKYERLDLSGAQMEFQLSPIDPDVRKELSSFIEKACPPNEAEHVTILLDCLLLLASDDGNTLFIWQ